MQYVKSYFVIGPEGTAKTHFSKHLGELTKLSAVKLSDFELLPPLADLEKWIQNPGQYEISYSKNDLEKMLMLRRAYPNLKNLQELGYDKKIELELLTNYGKNAATFYKKQFQNQLLEKLMDAIETDAVIQLDSDFPINFDDEFNKLIEQIKTRPEAEKLNQYFPHMDYIGEKVTKRLMDKVKNKVYLPLPTNESNRSPEAQKHKEDNDRFVKTGQYQKYATITINTDDFHTDKGIEDTAQIERGALIAQKAAQDELDKRPELPEKEKKDKPKKKSFFGKLLSGLLWLIPITWIVKGIQNLRVKKALEQIEKDPPKVSASTTIPPKQETQQNTTQQQTSSQQQSTTQQQSSSQQQNTTQQGTQTSSQSTTGNGQDAPSQTGQKPDSSSTYEEEDYENDGEDPPTIGEPHQDEDEDEYEEDGMSM